MHGNTFSVFLPQGILSFEYGKNAFRSAISSSAFMGLLGKGSKGLN